MCARARVCVCVCVCAGAVLTVCITPWTEQKEFKQEAVQVQISRRINEWETVSEGN